MTNESTTIEGSDGSTFAIDAGDRLDGNDPLLIPRIKTDFPDSEQVTMEVQRKFSGVTPEVRANMEIPTAKDLNAAATRGDWQENLGGNTQDEIALSRLSNELEVLQAEASKLQAAGSSIPTTLRNAIRAKSNSLDYQAQAMRNAAVDPVETEFNADRETMLSSYKTDMQLAVSQMMRAERVDKPTAMQLVTAKIDTFGMASELPQFARIQARMQRKYPGSF